MTITYSAAKEAALKGQTCIGNIIILEFMRAMPEMHLKVYLFALMQYENPYFANEDISLALGISEEEVYSAFDALQMKGFLRVVQNDPLHIEFLDYFAGTSTVTTVKGTHTELMCAIREIAKARVFTATEIKRIYDWSEVFGLPDDVIVVLVSYCFETKGSRVPIKYMDEVAKTWADMGIATAEAAHEYVRSQSEDIAAIRDIKRRWRVTRNATADEIALYRKWTEEWHIPVEVIMQACTEMVNAVNPTFGYLDAILQSYMENGVVDAQSYDRYVKLRSENEMFARKLFVEAGATKKPTRAQIDTITRWISEWHIPTDALILLAQHVKNTGKVQQFAYMARIVAEWNSEDIRNVEAARAYLTMKESGKGTGASSGTGAKKPAVAKYSQRKYTRDDLLKLGMQFGGENDDDDS